MVDLRYLSRSLLFSVSLNLSGTCGYNSSCILRAGVDYDSLNLSKSNQPVPEASPSNCLACFPNQLLHFFACFHTLSLPTSFPTSFLLISTHFYSFLHHFLPTLFNSLSSHTAGVPGPCTTPHRHSTGTGSPRGRPRSPPSPGARQSPPPGPPSTRPPTASGPGESGGEPRC